MVRGRRKKKVIGEKGDRKIINRWGGKERKKERKKTQVKRQKSNKGWKRKRRNIRKSQ